jgi:aryl-alcohol dehydrogenase
VVTRASNAVVVDPEVDLTLLGPLGCGIQTGSGTVLNRLKPVVGESLVVFGCGAVGLSAIMAAKLTGCSQIIAVDIHASPRPGGRTGRHPSDQRQGTGCRRRD